MRVHALALAAVVLGAAVAAACGGETEPTIGSGDGLVNVPPPTPQGGGSSGSSSGGGSSSGSTSGSSSGSTSGSSSGSASGDAGSTGDGQVTESCTVSWSTDVFPLFESTGAGTCGNSACHGATDPPTITDGDPATTYADLKVYPINGKDLIVPGDPNPADGSLECNLGIETPVCGVAQMPEAPGTLSQAQLTTIDTWIKCGAPQN